MAEFSDKLSRPLKIAQIVGSDLVVPGKPLSSADRRPVCSRSLPPQVFRASGQRERVFCRALPVLARIGVTVRALLLSLLLPLLPQLCELGLLFRR